MKSQKAELRAIMASGYSTPSVKSDLSAAGVERFIAKPYSLGQVVDAHEQFFKSKIKAFKVCLPEPIIYEDVRTAPMKNMTFDKTFPARLINVHPLTDGQ